MVKFRSSFSILHFAFWLFAFSFGFTFFTFFTNKRSNTDNDYIDSFRRNHKTFSVPIPDKLDFAGENVPLNMVDIRERVDRELSINVYWQSNTMLLIKRANRWFPEIEPILKKNHIPEDFKYLALIESGFIYNSSPAGAEGFWQFLKETGVKYGLEINNEVDERFNIEKSTEATCRYLNEAYQKYKSWTLAAVSFNAGFNGIDRQLDRQKILTPSHISHLISLLTLLIMIYFLVMSLQDIYFAFWL